MFEKDLSLSALYDLYGALLTPQKREVFEAYFLEDLSLAEIAEQTGTSRQAVRALIARSSEELQDYEKKLGLKAKQKKLHSLCDALAGETEAQKKMIEQIREML